MNDRRMLHLRSSAGFFGAERVIVTLLGRLPQTGVTPVLATIRNYRTGDRELLERARAAGIRAEELPCGGRFSLATLKALKALARDEGARLIHSHDYKSHFYGILAARALGVPVVATLHGWIRTTASLRFYQRIERLLLKRFDAVVTVSPAIASALAAGGLAPDRIHTVANGVDVERFHPDGEGLGRDRWGLGAEDFVFGTVARLSPEKGHRDLLEAFAAIAPRQARARLLIVGDGPERDALEALARARGVGGRVVFAGTEARVEGLMHDLDCYVSPSLTEGMPMVVLEAMASGIAVIGTEVGAVGDLLGDGAGMLVPAGDRGALAEAMAGAGAGEADLKAMGRRGRERAVARFSAGAQARAYAEIYGSVLEGRR